MMAAEKIDRAINVSIHRIYWKCKSFVLQARQFSIYLFYKIQTNFSVSKLHFLPVTINQFERLKEYLN